MLPSLRLGRIFQIETTIHWSFWLLLIWVFLNAGLGGGLQAGVNAGSFLLAVFLCVYLHELGHAFAAAQYGIRTVDITMLPIGGLARLERMPALAKQELWIALAGPAVNVVIALFLGAVLSGSKELMQLHQGTPWEHSFLGQILIVNVGLAVFNMLPAFPMDGGRVLRGLLQLRMSRLRATEIAVRVSRFLAIVLIIIGLFKAFTLVLIGIFVIIAGYQELLGVRMAAWRASSNGGASPFPFGNGHAGSFTGWVYEFPPRRSPSDWSNDPFSGPTSLPKDPPQTLDADDVRRIE